jgi:hypothetical protein
MLQNRCLGTLSVGGLSLVYRSWLTLAVILSHTAVILSAAQSAQPKDPYDA